MKLPQLRLMVRLGFFRVSNSIEWVQMEMVKSIVFDPLPSRETERERRALSSSKTGGRKGAISPPRLIWRKRRNGGLLDARTPTTGIGLSFSAHQDGLSSQDSGASLLHLLLVRTRLFLRSINVSLLPVIVLLIFRYPTDAHSPLCFSHVPISFSTSDYWVRLTSGCTEGCFADTLLTFWNLVVLGVFRAGDFSGFWSSLFFLISACYISFLAMQCCGANVCKFWVRLVSPLPSIFFLFFFC